MKHIKTLVVALGIAMWLLPTVGQSEEQSTQSTEGSAAPAKFLEAAVNPVTGDAICVNPRGAPVDPPPRTSLNRPCKPRAHDDDAFTVYEHYSGCDE